MNVHCIIGRIIKVVDNIGEQVRLGHIEERVQHVDARLRQVHKLVRVDRLDFGAEFKLFCHDPDFQGDSKLTATCIVDHEHQQECYHTRRT